MLISSSDAVPDTSTHGAGTSVDRVASVAPLSTVFGVPPGVLHMLHGVNETECNGPEVSSCESGHL